MVASTTKLLFLSAYTRAKWIALFPFDESRHLRHGILGWYRHEHVHVIGHHVAFEDLTLLLLRQPMKHFAQVLLQLSVQPLSPTLRDKNDVVLALPFAWLRLSNSSILDAPLVCLAAQDLEFP